MRFAADAMRQRGREQSQAGHEGGHQDRPQPHDGALDGRDGGVVAAPDPMHDFLGHDHAVLHRDAGHRDEADGGGHGQVQSGDAQGRQAPHQRERHHREHDAREPHRAEGPEQKREDQQRSARHDHHQALGRALRVLELTAPLEVVPGRKRHARRHGLAGLFHEAALVARQQVDLDDHRARARFAQYPRRPLTNLDLRDVSQRDRARPVAHLRSRQRELQVGDGVDAVAVLLRDADDDIEPAVGLEEAGHRLARERLVDQDIDVVDRDAVARQSHAIGRDDDLGLSPDAGRLDVRGAADSLDHRRDLGRLRFQDVEVAAADLDDDLALEARQRLLDVVLDHLREIGRDARDRRQARRHAGDERILVGEAPFAAWPQVDQRLEVVRPLRVGSVVRTSRLRDDVRHFGIRQQLAAHQALDLLRGIERRGGRQCDRQPDVAFVQLWQELAAQPGCQQQGERHGQRAEADRGAGVTEGEIENPAVAGLQPLEPGLVLLDQGAALDDERQQRRNQREGQQHGAQEGKSERQRHWREDLPLDTLEREDGHERKDDDRLREQHRMGQVRHRPVEDVQALRAHFERRARGKRFQGQAHHQRFDDHDGAVDDDAEIDCPEGYQVGGHTARVHQDEGKQQGQRNDRGHDQGGSPTGEKDHQHGGHQQRPDDQVLRHGRHGMPDKLRPVVDGDDLRAIRQALLQLRDACLQGRIDLGGIASLGHRYDAFDDAVAVVRPHDAEARPFTLTDFGDVTDGDSPPLARGHDHFPDVVEVHEQASRTDDQGRIALLEQAASGTSVAVGHGLAELIERDLVFAQCERIDLDLILLDRAAEAHDVGHAGRHPQGRPDRPVLQRPQLRVRQLGSDDRVAIDFADRGRQWRQLWLHPRGQRHRSQVLGHLLACEIVVGAVGEGQGDDGQARHRDGSNVRQRRNAGDRLLDRQRDGALHVFRRLAGELRDDLDLDVLDIRERFDRQVRQGIAAEADERDRQHQYEHALRQRKDDQAVDHELLSARALISASSNKAPEVTTRSPPASPSPT